ncbi:MAG: PDZ domain-containing protein, partial [Nostocaceae cyanobacterium]|nr:PDZ domain-containing protein [Nostocaceae cyanobacterium]
GKVEHPYLGIQMVTLTPEVKQKVNSKFGDRLRINADSGVLLIGIVPSSPAALAGLREGDVIQSINNQSVTKNEEVQKLVDSSKIGVPLQMQVQRNGQATQLTVKPAALPVHSEG